MEAGNVDSLVSKQNKQTNKNSKTGNYKVRKVGGNEEGFLCRLPGA